MQKEEIFGFQNTEMQNTVMRGCGGVLICAQLPLCVPCQPYSLLMGWVLSMILIPSIIISCIPCIGMATWTTQQQKTGNEHTLQPRVCNTHMAPTKFLSAPQCLTSTLINVLPIFLISLHSSQSSGPSSASGS